jgi:S1-C subfamily serine protease
MIAALIIVIAPGLPVSAQQSSFRTNVPASSRTSRDNTLEIAPRASAPEEPPPPVNQPPAMPSSSTSDNGASPFVAPPQPERPYLGVGVQYIYTHKALGQLVQGLEVVSVDPGSPAARAGLHGRGRLTEIGASGATAGALVPPLDLVMMPLLKKAGQLGRTGDLIVAIDDHRVDGPDSLADALDRLKPGDVVYFTVIRAMRNGSYKTLKLPVMLASPAAASSTRHAVSADAIANSQPH